MSVRTTDSQPNRERIATLPNVLTLGRLVLGFAAFAFITLGKWHWALTFFALAATTDALDGHIARALGQTSALGRQLDPFVDKVIVIGTLVYLLPVADSGLTAWMVVVILVRELGVQTLRSLVEGQGIPFGAKGAGKLKMVLQCFAVASILATLGASNAAPFRFVRDILIYAALATTVYSGFTYIQLAWPLLSRGQGS